MLWLVGTCLAVVQGSERADGGQHSGAILLWFVRLKSVARLLWTEPPDWQCCPLSWRGRADSLSTWSRRLCISS